jgi:tetratricopeptide (TPR) repeat protein
MGRYNYLTATGLIAGLVFFMLGFTALHGQVEFSLVEEDQAFWNSFLGQKEINNRNMLYASYLAYKERLTDLSIESFRECAKRNDANEPVKALANYYIGKNYFLLGQYREAIRYFTEASGMNLRQFNYLVHAIMLNMAISHHRLNDMPRFREIVGVVIEKDEDGKYQHVGRALLNQVK